MLLDSLIFHPDTSMPEPPSGVTERWIKTQDDLWLHAWYAAAGDAQPTLIWSHGNAGNIAGRGEVLRALAARRLNVLAYDYRGYGKSAGHPSEAGVYLDAQAAYDSERALGVPAARIVGFGESLGGAVSISLATQRPCAGVALVSTFTSMKDVARRHFGPLAFLAGSQFDSLARIRDVKVPILIAHGDRDEIVPFELGQQLFAAANEPKRFVRVKAAHHNDVFANPGLIDAIAEFARSVGNG